MSPAKQEFMQPSVFDVTKLDILIFDMSHCQGHQRVRLAPKLSAEPQLKRYLKSTT